MMALIAESFGTPAALDIANRFNWRVPTTPKGYFAGRPQPDGFGLVLRRLQAKYGMRVREYGAKGHAHAHGHGRVQYEPEQVAQPKDWTLK